MRGVARYRFRASEWPENGNFRARRLTLLVRVRRLFLHDVVIHRDHLGDEAWSLHVTLWAVHTPADPYARLATLLWMLKPEDVTQLVLLADELAEARLVDFLTGGGPDLGQATLRPQNRS